MRSFLLRSLKLLPAAPQLYPAVISVQQHLRHGAPLPDLRARILRVLQQPVPVALAGVALLIGQYPRYKAAHRIGHGHRRNLAAGEDKVAKGYLFVDALLNEALVHTLIVPADEHEMIIITLEAL